MTSCFFLLPFYQFAKGLMIASTLFQVFWANVYKCFLEHVLMTASEKDKKHMSNMSLREGFLNLADK